MTGFAMGEGQSHANYLVIDKDTPSLKGDVPALAKLIEENISVMNATGKIQLSTVSMDKSQPLKDKGSPSFKEDVTPALAAKLIEENILEMNAAGKIQLSLGRSSFARGNSHEDVQFFMGSLINPKPEIRNREMKLATGRNEFHPGF